MTEDAVGIGVVAAAADDVDELMRMTTPPSSEHRLAVTLDANRKHIISFPTTRHSAAVTFGDDVVVDLGSNMVLFQPFQLSSTPQYTLNVPPLPNGFRTTSTNRSTTAQTVIPTMETIREA